ncbi:hypothetical protein WN943_003151 [Citrus x changshan-huyou]
MESLCPHYGMLVKAQFRSFTHGNFFCRTLQVKISIIDDVGGLKWSGHRPVKSEAMVRGLSVSVESKSNKKYIRMTLSIGFPVCGKTSLLKALSGNLNKSLKILGVDFPAYTLLVGDAMRGGIYGGQKERLTTGKMIVGADKSIVHG